MHPPCDYSIRLKGFFLCVFHKIRIDLFIKFVSENKRTNTCKYARVKGTVSQKQTLSLKLLLLSRKKKLLISPAIFSLLNLLEPDSPGPSLL